MVVRDFIPEMNLLLLQHKGSRNGMDGRITPSLVEETTIPIQRGKIIDVFLRSQPVQAANLEI